MTQAASLARHTHPHPNPKVGALVLDAGGALVGRGWHLGPGAAHAEIVALAEAGDKARGGTVVVTLEPCNHTGRTPPCTEALLAAGVVRVVVGAVDPDQRVEGTGIRRLRQAGLEVVAEVGPMENVDPPYFHHRRTGRAHVTLKLAATLDGQIAAADGTSQWITGTEARMNAHLLRASSDAVMVGGGTVIADNPRLDVRLPDHDGFQPRPVIVAGRRPIPENAQIFGRDPLVVSTAPRSTPGELLQVPSGGDGLPDLRATLELLGERGLLAVLVEGGPVLARRLWVENLIDRGVFYFGGMVAGGRGHSAFEGTWSSLGEARPVKIEAVARLGDDLRIDFTVS